MSRAKTLYGINVSLTVERCPELGPLIPLGSRYCEGGRLGTFCTTAYSRPQAMSQFLLTLGSPDYRPRWAQEQLNPHLNELVEPVTRRGDYIRNFQLPMVGMLE